MLMYVCTSEQTDLSLHIWGERKLLLSDSSIFSDMTHLGRFIITSSKAMEPLSGERACAGVSAEAAHA